MANSQGSRHENYLRRRGEMNEEELEEERENKREYWNRNKERLKRRNAETKKCMVCEISFLRNTKVKGRSTLPRGVRRFGCLTCSKKCARELVGNKYLRRKNEKEKHNS